LGVLNGSGGGTWLDISATGLAQVGFIRFSVENDNNAATNLNFELDALSIATPAIGPATVPEPSAGLLMVFGALVMLRLRGRASSRILRRA